MFLESNPKITRLTLTDFRTYPFVRFETNEQFIVFTGPNGTGKTNILEAITTLNIGRGLRGASSSELARKDPNDMASTSQRLWAVHAKVENNKIISDIACGRDPNALEKGMEKRITMINGQRTRKQKDLANILTCHWVTPQMTKLFLEGNSSARNFFDRMIFNVDNNHASHLSKYEYTLKERQNILTKQHSSLINETWLDIIEDNIVKQGVAIAAARLSFLDKLNPISKIGHDPFAGAEVKINGTIENKLLTNPAIEVEEFFRGKLKENRQKDTLSNRNNFGTHKTTFTIFHAQKNQPAKLSSTGEQKALLISLILSNATLQTQITAKTPILLLDDIIAHLDNTRTDALFEHLQSFNSQCWLTSTEKSSFNSLPKDECKYFDI